VNAVQRLLRRIDAFQQGHTPLAVAVGVNKKFGDDNAGNLVTVLAYAGFVTLFPLLLVAFTVLGLVLAHDPSLRHSINNSVLHDFPLVGNQLQANVHTLQRSSTIGLVIGLVGLVWGSMGVAQAGIYSMSQIWNVPGPVRPSYFGRLLRSVEFLAVLGGGVVVTTFLAGFGTFGGTNLALGIVGELLAVAVNIGQYLLAFRILTPHSVGTRALMPGAVVAGVGWTVLQAAGGFVVGHYLKSSGAVYGTFGVVLGLLAWIYLGARLSLYAAELNTVLAGRLWPRGLVHPPLTAADQKVLDLQQQTAIVRPEQRVETTFSVEPMTQREYLDQGADPQPSGPPSTPGPPTEAVAAGKPIGGD
jgi:YihY family inner membrane protein